MPVDPDTYSKFLLAEKRAKELGLSLLEVLDRGQVLLTKKRRHDLEVQAVEDVLRRLDRQSANKIMSFYYGRVEGTASEMFEAMKLWLEVVARNKANGTLEEL
jgi:hypothetical protein